MLAPDVFGPVGDRTAYSWVSQKGVLTLGAKVPPAAWSRAAATVHGLQARIALSAAVIVNILQEELVKMVYGVQAQLDRDEKIADNAWPFSTARAAGRFKRCTARGRTWPGCKQN